MKQMTLFDLFDIKGKYPPEIEELDEKIKEYFKGYDIEKEGYYVWHHVPECGYRYCVTINHIPVDMIPQEDWSTDDLEVSITPVPEFIDNLSTLYITTYWKKRERRKKW